MIIKKFLPRPDLEKLMLASQIIFVILFVITLLSSVMVPIYSDEIAFKFIKTSVWLSDFHIKTFLPQCSVVPEVIPALLIPGAILYSFVYSSSDPVILRVIGIFIVLLSWLVLFSITAKIIDGKYKSKVTFLTLLSVSSLGIIPFIYILFRPEAIMMLGVLILIWGSLNVDKIPKESRWFTLLFVILFFIFSSLVFYAHSKALFFTPLIIFLVSLLYDRLGKIKTYLLGGAVLIIAFQTYLVGKGATECAESAYVTSIMKGHLLSLSSNFFDLISQLTNNILSSIHYLVGHVGFDSSYQSNWLPKDQDITLLQSSVGNISEWVISLFIFGVIFLFVAKICYVVFSREVKKNDIVGGLILVGILAQLALYNPPAMSFYNLGLIVPLGILSFVFLCSPFINKISDRALNFISLPIMLFGIISLLVLISNITYPLVNLNFNDKRIEISKSQPISAKTILAESKLESLKDLADKCQLPINNANRLIVDGVSFRIFSQMKEPVLIFYAEGGWIGKEIDPVFGQFFKNYGSDGVMAACRFIPKQMRDRVIEQDGMCCISKENLY